VSPNASTSPKTPLQHIKPEVRQIAGYRLTSYDCPVKLNQNESPFDVPDEIKDRILNAVRNQPWSRYPDSMPMELVAAIADYASVSPESIVVSNGSNTLAAVLLSVTVGPGSRVVMPSPSFSLYEQYTRVHGAEPVTVPLDENFEYNVGALINASEGATLVIVCSPNNPTGTALSRSDLQQLLEGTDALVLVDEAYAEFSGANVTTMLDRYPNLIVLRTLSKAFGAAGIRIGYLIAHPDIAAEVLKGKLPFNIGFFPAAAGLEILRHKDLIRERIASICSERDRVFAALEALSGVRPIPSEANFICMRLAEPGTVFTRLVELGVLVRDVTGYPNLHDALRVSIGTAEENNRFLEALNIALKEN